ncbi:hypothetical protein WG66_010600 [Moniliophthora roreri]|nr:hypothetical protein WG66_010600 [Moniliophthora roreri]
MALRDLRERGSPMVPPYFDENMMKAFTGPDMIQHRYRTHYALAHAECYTMSWLPAPGKPIMVQLRLGRSAIPSNSTTLASDVCENVLGRHSAVDGATATSLVSANSDVALQRPSSITAESPLHFKILCYSINCIKQHRYLRTKSEWEQMLSAFMDEVLRYLHTQVGKEYEARRFSFPPLWDERLAIPVVSLMAIFVEVDDLNRPVLQRSDYEAVSTPRVVSDLPTIRQVVPRQLPFTPISEPAPDHHRIFHRQSFVYSATCVRKDLQQPLSRRFIQLNWDVYLTNYDLNQQSPLLGLQGLPLPLGPDAAQGEPQLASDSSGTGRSRAVATSNSALSTATGLSAIASSSRNTVLGLTAVKCAREDPASPVSGGFFYGAIDIALLPRQGTRGRMTPARRERIDYSDGMEGRCD